MTKNCKIVLFCAHLWEFLETTGDTACENSSQNLWKHYHCQSSILFKFCYLLSRPSHHWQWKNFIVRHGIAYPSWNCLTHFWIFPSLCILLQIYVICQWILSALMFLILKNWITGEISSTALDFFKHFKLLQ